MRAAVSTVDLDPDSLVARVRLTPGMAGADLARTVTTDEPYEAAALVGPASAERGRVFRVAAYDFGMKRNILRLLAAAGIETTVFPAQTPPTAVAARGLRRRVPVERPRRPGGDGVRGRGGPRRCSARCRSSGSASATSCSASRSAAAPTRCRSGTAA